MRARRRRSEESQQQQQQQQRRAGGREEEEEDERYAPHPARRRALRVHCLSSDRNTIFFRERLRGAAATRRAAAPFRNRTLTVADESILRVFASLRASFSRAHLYGISEDEGRGTKGAHVFGRCFNPV
ncbi:unnamed protein product [Lasius platythorax]|uniref:Uncharacterized protein n=1 Tax=Lasius platythorax TaxID=488582 RepID=A0AAV2NFF3_9HYME